MLEFFSPRVAGLRRRRDVPGLVEALAQGSTRVRRAAANALVEIPDPRAIDALVTTLGDEDELVRVNAAPALGASRGPPARPPPADPLPRARHDDSPPARSMAAPALARAKEPTAVPALIDALQDRDGTVVATVEAVLPTFGDPRAE